MTDAVLSQEVVEVIRINNAPTAQVSQEAVEVIRVNNAPTAQLSQIAIEVIRKVVPTNNRPITFINT